MQAILTSLRDESDADVDIHDALEQISALLRIAGEEEIENFLAANGFGVALQFFTDAYAAECADVLLAALRDGRPSNWPPWMLRRLLLVLHSDDTSAYLKEVVLCLLRDGSRGCPERLDAVVGAGPAELPNLLALLGSRPISYWTARGFEALLGILEMSLCCVPSDRCVRRGGKALGEHCIVAILSALENAQLHTLNAELLLRARMRGESDERIEQDERMLDRYVSLLSGLSRHLTLRVTHRDGSEADASLLSSTSGTYGISRTGHRIHSGVLEEVRALVKASPNRIRRVLDWNGKLKSFEESSFGLMTREGVTPLSCWLDLIRQLVVNKASAKRWYQSDLTGVMKELSLFNDDAILESLTVLYGQLALHSSAIVDEILDDKKIVALCGLLQTSCELLISKGLSGVCEVVDRLSGNGYIWFETSPLGLQKVFEIYKSASQESELKKASREVIQACLERSRRMERVPAARFPMRHPWKSMHSLLSQDFGSATGISTPVKHSNASPEPAVARRQGGCPALQAYTVPKKQERGNAFDEDGIRVVFDSGPSEATKADRHAWKQISLNDKIGWTQTSEDILLWITLPRGTKARDLTVDIEPCRLRLKLDWYGRVVDGPLHRRCKASEALWVLQDAELHITLPKDDSHFWKSLFEGSTEKSFHEIIQESVDSDEPLKNYDEIDPRARDLVEEIRERQRMIAQGTLDLEGFDDFRIVVGDNSL